MPFYEDAPREKTFVRCNFKVTSELKPASERRQSYQVEIDQIKLTDLPGIMRNMRWSVAPRLMEKWFAGKAYAITDNDRKMYDDYPLSIPPEHYDDSIVTIAWAQKFKRFQECCRLATADFLTPKSKEELELKLKKAGWPGIAPCLGHSGMSARELNELCQIQTQSFGSWHDDVDDMYGALGKAMVQVAAMGHVRRRSGERDIFVFEKLGLYIKDVYEFNGDQFLGLWTREGTLGKLEMLARLTQGVADLHGDAIIEVPLPPTEVRNAHFREYRETYGMGGDFIIYSDVLWVDVPGAGPSRLLGVPL